jgi:hypothetical protein
VTSPSAGGEDELSEGGEGGVSGGVEEGVSEAGEDGVSEGGEDGVSADAEEDVPPGAGVSMGGRTGRELQSNATTCIPPCANVTDPSLSVLEAAPNSESGPTVPPGAPRTFAAS